MIKVHITSEVEKTTIHLHSLILVYDHGFMLQVHLEGEGDFLDTLTHYNSSGVAK